MEITKAKLEEMKREMEARRAQGMTTMQQAQGAILAIDHLMETLDKPEEGAT